MASALSEISVSLYEENKGKIYENKHKINLAEEGWVITFNPGDLKNGKYDDLLVYKKSLRKPVEEYVKMTPPHVKAVRKLKNFSGNVVRYVYTKDGVEPLELAKGNYDYAHYIKKQLKPIADSILVFFNVHFEDMLSGQKTLFGY